jgi:hypothetical protein
MTLVASLGLRNRHAGGVVVAALAGGLVLPRLLSIVTAVANRLEPWQAALWIVLLVATVAVGARVLLLRARRWTWPRVTTHLNVFAGILLAVVLFNTLTSGALAQAARDLGIGTPSRVMAAEAGATPEATPDVIVLLLDGYPRADTLARHFDFDNEPFLDALRELDFAVASRSRANYTFTQLTLISMFHMRHLDALPGYQDITEQRVRENPRVRNLINDNPVFDQFRAFGYRLESIPPGIERVSVRSVDELHEGAHLREFEYHLLRSTALGSVVSVLDPLLLARQHHSRIASAFETIEALGPPETAPRFVLGHVAAPHLPVVFEGDGSLHPAPYSDNFFADTPPSTDQAFRDTYVAQLEWLNSRVLEAVDAVIADNPEAVVIVMSDHGSATHFRWEDRGSDLDERFSTLFAARTPGHSGVFADNQTPVNVFPRLFNSYFGTSYPLLPDTTYTGVVEFLEAPNPDADR